MGCLRTIFRLTCLSLPTLLVIVGSKENAFDQTPAELGHVMLPIVWIISSAASLVIIGLLIWHFVGLLSAGLNGPRNLRSDLWKEIRFILIYGRSVLRSQISSSQCREQTESSPSTMVKWHPERVGHHQ
jgi:hypothetical protein